MADRYVNDAQTTLAAGIDDSTSTLTVADESLFPATGSFRIRIGDELLLVTAVSGTTWTAIRGVEGTTATSHDSADLVTHVVTAASLVGVAQHTVLAQQVFS